MEETKIGYLLVNFGGPRSLTEIEPFLRELLTDKEVIRTKMPSFFHHLIFRRVAKKRAAKISKDYEEIGGRSPIFEDTEAVAAALRERVDAPVMTFHRYLPATHQSSCELIEKMRCDEIHVFPMFPQFTYATTGSIARFFFERLSPKTVHKLRWVKSYPTHPAFITLVQNQIRGFLEEQALVDRETILLFSPHGLPKKFVETGDLYEWECTASYRKIMEAFPQLLGKLAFQSKFGPGEWLRPYTVDVCEGIRGWHEGRKNVVFVPLSFTSDHIETLFEIEKIYMPIIESQGLHAYRVPAFNRSPAWIKAIVAILQDFTPTHTSMLVRWKGQ